MTFLRLRLAALAMSVAAAGIPAAAAVDREPMVQVSEERGTYRVAADFCVSQPAAVVLSVLSDYEAIPRFMPEVQSSRIIERADRRVVLEQEAVARLMMFSKRIHLVLEVDQTPNAINFRDRSHRSFSRYEGAWHVVEDADGAAITYQVLARPAFDVPEFILKRLLKRDATRMIENLRAEIATRGARR
jgi:ribosome-associated toxin RatA of RatAB toxin-antitoxin module